MEDCGLGGAHWHASAGAFVAEVLLKVHPAFT